MRATSPTQIRINTEIKEQAMELFEYLGTDLSSVVNMFLAQCVLRGGIPLSIEIPNYNRENFEAMFEAKRISRDPDVKGYDSMDELKKGSSGNLLFK